MVHRPTRILGALPQPRARHLSTPSRRKNTHDLKQPADRSGLRAVAVEMVAGRWSAEFLRTYTTPWPSWQTRRQARWQPRCLLHQNRSRFFRHVIQWGCVFFCRHLRQRKTNEVKVSKSGSENWSVILSVFFSSQIFFELLTSSPPGRFEKVSTIPSVFSGKVSPKKVSPKKEVSPTIQKQVQK